MTFNLNIPDLSLYQWIAIYCFASYVLVGLMIRFNKKKLIEDKLVGCSIFFWIISPITFAVTAVFGLARLIIKIFTGF